MTNTLYSFDLTGLDMAVAISQSSLNTGLVEWLQGNPIPFSWQYDYINNEFVPPQDPQNPQFQLTATLVAPSNGAVVDMSGAGANNQVVFYVSLSQATFVNNVIQKTYQTGSSGQEAPIWALGFQTDLTLTPSSGLAPAAYSALQNIYGDVFALNEVLIDLSTALASSSSVDTAQGGVDPYSWGMLATGSAYYLSVSGPSLFGAGVSLAYAALKGASDAIGGQPLPTLTPTSAALVVLPGGATYPNQSAMVFGLMTGGNAMPADPASDFLGMGGADLLPVLPSGAITGAALVRSDLFLSELSTVLSPGGPSAQTSPLAALAAQYVNVVADPTKDGDPYDWNVLTLNSPPAVFQTLTPSSANPSVATYTMPSQTSRATEDDAQMGASATTTSTLTLCFSPSPPGPVGYDTLAATGTMTFWGGESDQSVGWNSPTFVFDWNANFSIEPQLDSGSGGGGIGFVFQADGSAFPSQPTSQQGSWGAGGQAPPDMQQFLTNMLGGALSTIQTNIQTGLATSMQGVTAFVFPGGGDFTFSAAGVTSLFALYAVVNYQNPN